VLPGDGEYLIDATEHRGLRGSADAVALPTTTDQVARTLAWCYAHDIPLVPRGGGTGFAAGAVPVHGGVVLSLKRMTRVRAFDPLLWRIYVEAGLTTAALRRLARENGLFFPPDPGAAEQSQVGGNIATNAGGPHAFKYGATGAWVTGLEAVVAPGEVIRLGGPIRKDVAGYDLKNLLVGSEGTLAVITAAWLKLLPAPESFLPVTAVYPDTRAGCQGELVEVLSQDASGVYAPTERSEVDELWRWRDGVSMAVTAQLGGKVSEDIVVPVDRLQEAVEETIVIGHRHELTACSWGHAGDGNLHSTFLVRPASRSELERASRAAGELFALAARLGGSISGEHGVGWVKRGQLARQWTPAAVELHAAIKRAFDPKNLLNPGKKVAA
jgi:FAD/FMN-containing dehydrogenase